MQIDKAQQPLTPSLAPPVTGASEPPVNEPAAKPGAPASLQRLAPFGIALGGILIGMLLFILLQNTIFRKPVSITPAPTPTLIPTATPMRQSSKLSQTQGFIDLDRSVSTLSTTIQSFSVSEPMLQPPSLILPLGFSPK